MREDGIRGRERLTKGTPPCQDVWLVTFGEPGLPAAIGWLMFKTKSVCANVRMDPPDLSSF
ncbi:protein of unknown function [Thiomonas sp. Bio17B3]|nr:protein of unknown function [Thiomonas sp. Bio17B3]VDY09000.1 protein of unknown function [Thiomonas sp. Sup16B3]VDY12072.1 protein of unknown function [Thiomonas sp. OC7]VDY18711.1 Hypothetical protein CB2_110092 [Thiomonas sp. CB2]